MRQNVSISVPPTVKKEIDAIVHSGMYDSTSDLVRDAVRHLKERALVQDLKRSQRAARRGQVIKLSSLRDLR